MMINSEEISVTFDASDVLVNGEAVYISEAARLEAIFLPALMPMEGRFQLCIMEALLLVIDIN